MKKFLKIGGIVVVVLVLILVLAVYFSPNLTNCDGLVTKLEKHTLTNKYGKEIDILKIKNVSQVAKTEKEITSCRGTAILSDGTEPSVLFRLYEDEDGDRIWSIKTE